MKRQYPIIIAITGPESTGKTSLLKALQESLPNARSVKEFARVYLEKKARTYALSADEILDMMQGQIDALRATMKLPCEYVVIDTDDVMSWVWITELFGEIPQRWSALSQLFPIQFTLLCAPDLEWQYDPLRVNPHDRDRLFVQYEAKLKAMNRAYAVVDGIGSARLNHALKALQTAGITTNV